MNHIVLLFVAFSLLSIAAPAIFRGLRGGGPREKARTVVDYVQSRGYVLVNPVVAQVLDASRLEMAKNPALRGLIKASSDIADIEGLEQGTEDWLAFTCTLGSKEATIFNLSVTSRTPSNTSGDIRYMVAKVKAAGLPQFSLGKNSIVHAVQNAVDKMVGTAKSDIKIDGVLYPEFSTHYWLKGSDPDAVTRFLSPEKIKFVETSKLEGVLATNAHYLVYFEDGVLLNETDFDSFISRIERLAANIL
jgi:hypothetical protein